MQTWMTIAPGFTPSALTFSGRPTTALRMSALRQTAGSSFVREWAVAAVALQCRHRLAEEVGEADHDSVKVREIVAMYAAHENHGAGGGAGDGAAVEITGRYLAGVDDMQVVDVFFRPDRLDDRLGIESWMPSSAFSVSMRRASSFYVVFSDSVCWMGVKPHSLAIRSSRRHR